MSGSAAPNWDDTFDQAGSQYDVDPALLKAIQHVENAPGDPNATSKAGAKGLMQLMPGTASSVGVTDRSDPQQSIFGGAAYLRQMLDSSKGDIPTALARYNAGPNGDLSNPETQAYVPKVAAAYQRFAQADTGTATDATPTPPSSAASSAALPPDPDAARLADLNAQWGVGSSTSTSAQAAPTASAPADPDAARLSALNAQWGVAPQQAPAADAGELPAPQPGDTTSAPATPSNLDNFGSGVRQGFLTAPSQLAGRLQSTAMGIDRAIPALGNLDAAAGYTPQSVRASNNALAQQTTNFQAGAGQTGYGQTGNALGNALISAPAYMAGGAVLGGIAKGAAATVATVPYLGATANALAPLVAGEGGSTLAGKVAAGGVSGAVQGGLAGGGLALATGGNALAGATSGAGMGLAGGSAGGALGYVGGKIASGLGIGTGPKALPQPEGATATASADDLGPGSTGTPAIDAPPPDLTPQSIKALADKIPAAPIGVSGDPLKQGSHAETVIRTMAGGQMPTIVPSQIPGVKLTAGPATGNAGAAQLERWARQVNPLAFQPVDNANQAARVTFLKGITGQPDDLSSAIDARDTYANQTLEGPDGIFADAPPVSVSPVQDALDTIKASAGYKARGQVRSSVDQMQSSLDALTGEDGTAAPGDLYNGLRKSMDDLQGGLSQNANATPQAAREIGQVRSALDDTVEPAAPGFAAYRANYAQRSQQIGAQQYLQGQLAGVLGSDGAKPLTTASLNSVITGIQKAQLPGSKTAPTAPVMAVTPEQLQGLVTLRNDMNRETGMNRTMAPGSNTFGNFGTNALMSTIESKGPAGTTLDVGAGIIADTLAGMGGPGALAVGLGTSAIRNQLARRTATANAGVNEALIQRLARPSMIRGAMPSAPNALATPPGGPGS